MLQKVRSIKLSSTASGMSARGTNAEVAEMVKGPIT
jgi:hypothetical protein